MKVNKIDDELYQKQWSDEENRKIMNSACYRYRGLIPDDEIESCQMIALWKSIISFNPACGVLFSTYLYRGVQNLCRQYLVKDAKYYRNISTASVFKLYNIDAVDLKLDAKDIIDKLPSHYKDVIIDRFYNKLTFKEIASKNGYSYETARRNLSRAICTMKKILKSNSYA